jgi:GH35 family endo-1,4-beta-xylanase
MSDLTVMVSDSAGQPMPDAHISVTMTRHAFGFGSAVVGRLLMDESPDGEAYRRVVAENYNKVVFENDLKWGPWEAGKSGNSTSFRRQWVEDALAWLKQRNIDVRGHWLSWGSVSSGGQERFVGKPEEHRKALFEHIREKVDAVGDRVVEWDAINHPVGWGVTYEEMHGGLDFHADIFRLCREVVPQSVDLWINEGQILPGGARRDAYERIIRYLIEHGQAPDGIGFMGHFGASSLTPIDELYDVFERFADIIPVLQLTELDVNVPNDEQLQADYLRDVMTLAFSHPAMKGILTWGFWEGKIWKPHTALYRRDWSLKPAGKAWLDLVKNQWWTRADGYTGRDGEYTVRAFHGTYTIEVTAEGKSATAQADVVTGSTTVGIRLR